VPTVIDNNGNPIDSEYLLNEIDGISGLILESWGPKTRNPQYNKAFDTILERLIYLDVPYITVYVISANLIKAFPEIQDRAISINHNKIIQLQGWAATELRLAIGREQADLKIDPKSKGGNRTKRILIYCPDISPEFWSDIAQGAITSGKYLNKVREPTSDKVALEEKVKSLLFTDIPDPTGNLSPNKTSQNTEAFVRDPKVKAWVLKSANGICELCNSPAPFIKQDGMPYLEVHHVLPLSEGGSDRVSNTVAVCPNCHMKFHYSSDKLKIRKDIIHKTDRLISENSN